MNRLTITDLRVEQFRKFAKPIQLTGLGPGLNLLCAPNEAGKSTLKAALDAAFFTRHRVGGEAAKALRTQNNDAPPVVQVSFELGDDAYTLTKRFHRQHRARLVRPGGELVDGDAAEEELQSLLGFETVGGRASAKAEALGVWGLLWVAQGDSFAPLQVSASARGSLEACLAGGEVSAITGGARGHRVAEKVRSELAKHITAGRGQPTGRYAQISQEKQTAVTALAEAQQLKAELAEQLTQLEISRRDRDAELREIDEAAEQKEIADLRQRLSEAQRVAERANTAKLNLDLAKRDLTQAEEAATRRQALVEQLAEMAKTLASAEAEHAQQTASVQAALKRLETAEKDFTKANDASIQARRRVQTLNDRAKWQRLKDASGEKQTRLEQALAAAREAAAAAGEAQALQATDQAIKKLRALASQRDAAAAARTAAATVLRFALTGDGVAAVRLNSKAVPPSGEAAVTRPATLDLGRLGQIEIRPGVQDAATIDQTLADAEQALLEAVQALSCSSLADAEAQAERRRRLLQSAEAATEKAKLFAPDLEGQAGRIADALETAKEDAAKADEALAANASPEGDTLSAEEAVEDAATALQKAEAARQDRYDARARERQTHALAEQSAQQAANALQSTKSQRENVAQTLDTARGSVSDESQSSNIAAAQKALAIAQAQHMENLQRSQDTGTPESIDAQINRREKAREVRRNRIAKLGENIASLEAQIRAKSERGPDEAVALAEESLARLAIEQDRIERDVAALQLLDRTLREAQASVEARYLEPVTQKLRPHLASLFGDAQLSLAGDFSLQTLERLQRTEDISQLSAGTQEQLAILSRLAFAEVLAEQGRPVVLLLDDALVYADDRRIQDMFSALERAADRFQVIVLSCRQRVFDGLGGENQRRLSIEPCEPIDV